jgi:hypothetical protein
MVLARYERPLQDVFGNLLDGTVRQIQVRRENTGTLAVLYSDRDGATPMANPFTVSDGKLAFHVVGGAYRILPVGFPDDELRYVGIGTAQEQDANTFNAQGWQYQYETELTAPPTVGCVRFNNANLASVTTIYVSIETLNGSDAEAILLELDPGAKAVKNRVMFADQGNGVVVSYDVDAAVDSGAYITLTVSDHVGATSYSGAALFLQREMSGRDGFDQDDARNFATLTEAESYNPGSPPAFTRTAGYSAAGDGGGALYKYVAAEPSHEGKYEDAAGNWYEIASIEVRDKQFGAKGDAIGGYDGVATATDNTFTSATAAFALADVGKAISIIGAGAAGVTLHTTIASRNSATSIELTTAASTSGTGLNFVYGTNDTAATQNALDYLRELGGGKCWVTSGRHMLIAPYRPTDDIYPGYVAADEMRRANKALIIYDSPNITIEFEEGAVWDRSADAVADSTYSTYSTTLYISGADSENIHIIRPNMLGVQDDADLLNDIKSDTSGDHIQIVNSANNIHIYDPVLQDGTTGISLGNNRSGDRVVDARLGRVNDVHIHGTYVCRNMEHALLFIYCRRVEVDKLYHVGQFTRDDGTTGVSQRGVYLHSCQTVHIGEVIMSGVFKVGIMCTSYDASDPEEVDLGHVSNVTIDRLIINGMMTEDAYTAQAGGGATYSLTYDNHFISLQSSDFDSITIGEIQAFGGFKGVVQADIGGKNFRILSGTIKAAYSGYEMTASFPGSRVTLNNPVDGIELVGVAITVQPQSGFPTRSPNNGILMQTGAVDGSAVALPMKGVKLARCAVRSWNRNAQINNVENAKISDNTFERIASKTVTMDLTSNVISSTGPHGLPDGASVVFSTTGALPTGLTAGTTYYVVSTGDLLPYELQVALTSGGAAINISGSQSGVHTMRLAGIAAARNYDLNIYGTANLHNNSYPNNSRPNTVSDAPTPSTVTAVSSAGVPIKLVSETVANIGSNFPVAQYTGCIVWATNGRKNGEGAGAGTGVMAFSDGTQWRACDTGATLAA